MILIMTKLPEWDFSPYYSGTEDPKIREVLAIATGKASQFKEKYKGRLNELDILAFRKMLEELEEIMLDVYPISMYSGLLMSKQSQNSDYKQFQAEVQEKTTKIFNETVFLSLEINNLNEDKFNSLLGEKELENYIHFLKDKGNSNHISYWKRKNR